MRLTDNLYVKCNKCEHISIVEMDSMDCETLSYERSMGEEIEYNFHGEVCCEVCSKWIEVNVRGYEYPVGAFNFSDYDCSGGEFVKEPTFEIEYEFNVDYSDDVYNQYIEANCLLEYHKEKIKSMSPRDFEVFVAGLFEKLGFSVNVTKATRDGGKDIIATKSDPIPYTLIVECKHWGEQHKVDVSVVRSLYGVQTAEQANQSIVVTSSKFTKDARKFAEERKNLMTLWDIDDLLNLI